MVPKATGDRHSKYRASAPPSNLRRVLSTHSLSLLFLDSSLFAPVGGKNSSAIRQALLHCLLDPVVFAITVFGSRFAVPGNHPH